MKPFISAAALALIAFTAAAGDRLPTGVRLDPIGRAIPVGNMPLAMVVAPDHRHVVVSLGGWLTQGLQVVDLQSGEVTQTIEKNAAFLGLAFGGDTLYASGGHDDVVYAFKFRDGRLGDERSIAVKYPSGIAVSSDGRMLYVAENLADDLAIVDLAEAKVIQRIATDHYPYAIAVSGDRLYVSAWGGDTVSMFRALKSGRVISTGRLAVGRHPSALALDGSMLYAALASVDEVAVIDTATRRVIRRLDDRSPSGTREGSTPNALAVSADRVYVAEADSNAVAVFDKVSGALLGRLPTDWYPLGVAIDGDRLIVLNGKGTGTRPNPDGPRPLKPIGKNPQYDLAMIDGTIRVIPLPAANLAELSNRVAAANNWSAPRAAGHYPPFKHVIYVIKENRTYDQVMGDVPEGNGDPSLVFFGRDVTPNEHALAQRFGLFDHFFVNAEVSAQGHPWSDAAYVTDYIEKTVHTLYAHKRPEVDEGDTDEPVNGYLWDSAVRAGISLRVYGEYAQPVENTPYFNTTKRFQADINPDYPWFDMKVPDQHRVDIWLAEFGEYGKNGELPALEIVQLPRDHTAAGKAGYSTPRACVADNDLALGRMVEALSNSPFWRDTVMIVLEDDAQDGADHIDSHRSPFFVISAYNRPGVQHRFANTTDAVATIEQILGLEPLSQFDSFGRALSDIFSDTADLSPYRAIAASVPLDEVNPEKGSAAKKSAKFDVSKPDAVDGAEFNRVLREMLQPKAAASRRTPER